MVEASSVSAARRRVRPALVVAVTIFLLWQVLRTGISGILLEGGRARSALDVWPGSASAAAQLSEEAMHAGHPAEATTLAMRALRTSSQNSQALRVIAEVQRQAGQFDASDSALILAARLGWRDSFAMRWLFARAMATRDWLTASQAADALLRTDADEAPIFAMLERMATTPPGRSALAERMAAQPAWADHFVKQYHLAAGADIRPIAELILELENRGVRPGDKVVEPLFNGLFKAGRPDQALSLWRTVMGDAAGDPTRAILDGDFDAFAAEIPSWGPFGWRAGNDPAVTVKTASRTEFEENPALAVDVEGYSPAPAIWQRLVLTPGKYELNYAGKLQRGSPEAFRWEVVCLANKNRLLHATVLLAPSAAFTSRSVSFRVPATGCAAQKLVLMAGPVGRDSASLLVDAIRLVQS